jgi:phage gpG-like protein
MLTLKLDFNRQDFQPFQHAGMKAIKELNTAIRLAAFAIRNEAVKGISQGQRHGNIYYRRGISHQAAADGEYPKTDTGRLVASIRTDFSFLTADIGSDLDYSKYLEEGTKYMGAKPWLAPSAAMAESEIQRIIDDALARAFQL